MFNTVKQNNYKNESLSLQSYNDVQNIDTIRKFYLRDKLY